MDGIVKSFLEKLSSYNLFNCFFPGFIFCYVLNHITRFSFLTGCVWENLIVCYFVGMVLSRFGALVCEPCLQKISRKGKKFILHEEYTGYLKSKQKDSDISILLSERNVYRTLIAAAFAITIIKMYDWMLYDLLIEYTHYYKDLMIVILSLMAAILFVFSFRRQNGFIVERLQTNNYTSRRNDSEEKK